MVAVGGGIAAYKAAELVRLLVRHGADVTVAMTPAATRFVGPLTFQALSGKPVFTELLDLSQDSAIGHISLADQAEAVVVAPATANLMARLAQGRADDAVTALVLATRAPVLLAPAMNVNMWTHPLTQANLETLRTVAGYHVIGPDDGDLACRWVGPGRMAEPEQVVVALGALLRPADLKSRRVVVTAGPTHEPLDPVRFIGNRSSGKMGYALARSAARRGAEVTLVSGPVKLARPPGIAFEQTQTAREMHAAVLKAADGADAVIMAAAVADVRPVAMASQKLKKGKGQLSVVELEDNPDILKDLGLRRNGNRRPVLIGFAAETADAVDSARAKLRDKKCDAVVANDVSLPGIGFDSDFNRGTLVTEAGTREFERMSKDAMADRILDWLGERLADGSAG